MEKGGFNGFGENAGFDGIGVIGGLKPTLQPTLQPILRCTLHPVHPPYNAPCESVPRPPLYVSNGLNYVLPDFPFRAGVQVRFIFQ